MSYGLNTSLTSCGVIFSLSYGVVLSAQLTLAKRLVVSNNFHPIQVAFFRCLIHLFCILLNGFGHQTDDFTVYDTILYFICALTGVLSWLFTAATFQDLESGDSTAIEIGATVVFTTIMAHVYLSEYVDKFDVMLLLLDATGIVLISKPSFLFGQSNQTQTSIKGVFLALISALFCSMWLMFVKKLSVRKTLHFMLLNFIHGVVGIPVALLCSFVWGSWVASPSWDSFALILLFSFASLVQTMVQATALNLEDAKTVAVSSTISTVLTYIVQLTVFKARFDWIVIVGALLVTLTVIFVQLKDIKERLFSQ
ncbi:Solute carrier family 35 member G1 [Holothuria leucospilota]|uniref:Solute carrier family 35 member G1 n=1 Tax=Holothuria leucospilota TaxID=206669 RepID=A0A9Q1H7Q1_HOLLE|nr:Solute carrier family 35 member G1 [Holothuria leucospilota]